MAHLKSRYANLTTALAVALLVLTPGSYSNERSNAEATVISNINNLVDAQLRLISSESVSTNYLVTGKLLAQALPVPVGDQAQVQYVIATLPDGNYQFCSEPEPKDWLLGAGVCFWFRKVDNRLVGYYGYPHSSNFINCVSGEVDNNILTGEALAISWPGHRWIEIPKSTFEWDEEGRLKLSRGSIVHTEGDEGGGTDWIQFLSATLDLNGFYRYSADKVSQMKSPPESCEIEQWIEN
ncbi:MAG: hypothetical protein AB4426_00650 [Xenococcaceae cyanobacterium]